MHCGPEIHALACRTAKLSVPCDLQHPGKLLHCLQTTLFVHEGKLTSCLFGAKQQQEFGVHNTFLGAKHSI